MPAAPGPGAPSVAELGAATYTGLEEAPGPVTLVDGAWEGPPYAPEGASRPRVSLVRDFRATGDLDGDGAEEAVVLLSASSGGSGSFVYLAVAGRDGGEVRNRATQSLGDRVQVRAARVAAGRVSVDVLQAGPGDAACCPGELAKREFVLGAGGALREVPASDPPSRLSLEALSGTTWVLRRWTWGEAAAAEPVVTLAFRAGRFSGSSGCNAYFATAADGAAPGDVSVGPPAATRRACQPPAMEVEARFLRQLASVDKYGFLAGRLALSFQEEGVRGTMLFEGRPPDPVRSP